MTGALEQFRPFDGPAKKKEKKNGNIVSRGCGSITPVSVVKGGKRLHVSICIYGSRMNFDELPALKRHNIPVRRSLWWSEASQTF